MLFGQTVQHRAFAYCDCRPLRSLCLPTTTQTRSRPAQPTRTAQQAWRPVAAQRTAVATDNEPDPDNFPAEAISNFSASQARRTTPIPTPVSVAQLVSIVFQLTVVIGLLLILPSWFIYHSVPARVWTVAAVYSLFFGFGGIRRVIKYGKLSSREQDAQVATANGSRNHVLFIATVVAGHWASMWPRIKLYTDTSGQRLLALNFTSIVMCPPSQMVQLIAAAVMAAALALHVWSCETLGKAHDRLVVPDALVKTGPYAWCQHPIYTSYMMLFLGATCFLKRESIFLFALKWFLCLPFFEQRAATEAELLQKKFGNEYTAYKEHTGIFWPKFA